MRTRIAGGSVFRTLSVLNWVNPHNKKDLGQCPKPLVSRGFGAVGGI